MSEKIVKLAERRREVLAKRKLLGQAPRRSIAEVVARPAFDYRYAAHVELVAERVPPRREDSGSTIHRGVKGAHRGVLRDSSKPKR